ncbi:vitamin B12 transporter [Gammaproteobacteria bacterium]
MSGTSDSLSSIILVLPFVVPILAFANEALEDTLPMVVVTATRTPRSVDRTLAPITVLEHKELVQSDAVTVPDVLRNVPGMDFNSSGGLGKLTNLSLRGTNPNHVLLLVDGIPLGSATVGTPAWEYLPLAQARRIEVVRGPRSSLYGSSAIGGIVQMFTPQGEGPTHVDASVMTGSLDTHDARASIAGASGDTHFHLGGGWLSTTGINAGSPFSLNESDADGYRNSSVALRLDHHFDNAEIDFHLLRATGHGEFDGASDENFLQRVAGINWTFSPHVSWETRITMGESRDERDSVPKPATRYHTRRVYVAWQNDWMLIPDQRLTIGMDRQQDHVDSNDAYTITSQVNNGFFLQHQATFGRHELIAGARYDDHQAFGGHTTGNLAYGMHLAFGLCLTAAWGSAFRAPTFNDLYWPLSFGYQGNPNLHPETANSYEVGLTAKPVWGNWELRVFRTDIDDLITYDGSTTPSSVRNLAHARIDGLEAGVVRRIKNWNLSASLAVLDPRDRDTDKVLPRRTHHTAQIGIAHQFGALRSALTVLNQGGRYDDVANGVHLKGYALVGLRLDYALDRAWTLTGWVDNLLDEDYQTVSGYNTPGRVIMTGVRYALH